MRGRRRAVGVVVRSSTGRAAGRTLEEGFVLMSSARTGGQSISPREKSSDIGIGAIKSAFESSGVMRGVVARSSHSSTSSIMVSPNEVGDTWLPATGGTAEIGNSEGDGDMDSVEDDEVPVPEREEPSLSSMTISLPVSNTKVSYSASLQVDSVSREGNDDTDEP